MKENTRQQWHQNYAEALKEELVPALGCTEPIAIALASAAARYLLGGRPEKIVVRCSGNVVKNVKSVTIPNTGGLKGIEAAAIAGALGGDHTKNLEVLKSLPPSLVPEIKALLLSHFCSTELVENEENLFIEAILYAGMHRALVQIEKSHTLIRRAELDGKPSTELLRDQIETEDVCHSGSHKHFKMNMKDILEFADTVALQDVEALIAPQIQYNSDIADEGLRNAYGVGAGRMLIHLQGTALHTRAKAKAAAGSDARMGGSMLPVVVVSGSGNQGMTVSLPIIEFAKDLKSDREKLYRALVLGNLTAIHIKSFIGKLSAFCGAVCAAAGAGAGIAYLRGGGYREISAAITMTLASVGGMICDGAKSSCALKIAAAVDTALFAVDLAMAGQGLSPGEGIVEGDVESTIENIGKIGKDGMKVTDQKILDIMLNMKY